jgi:hypothetical protein
MRIKRLNENIEWTTYRSSQALKFLEEVFDDFINPIEDGRRPAKTHKIKAGRAMLAVWEIDIPINIKNKKIEDTKNLINSLLNEVNENIKLIEENIEGIRHSIEIKNSDLVLSIWSTQKD